MKLRSWLSSFLGARLTRSYKAQLDRGDVWTVPTWAWDAIPVRVRRWLEYRVYDEAGAYARELAERDPDLRALSLPSPNPYSLSPITRVVFRRILEMAQSRRILELGSGVSTLISAAYASSQGWAGNEPAVCSVDHDGGWLEETRGMLKSAGLAQAVRLIHAPLCEREVGGSRVVTYGLPEDTLEKAAGSAGFDLCLIDGPPVGVGRDSCLALVAPFLACGATILLDDGIRTQERSIWREWRRLYPSSLVETRYAVTDRGLLMGKWVGRGPRPMAAQHDPSTGRSLTGSAMT